MLPVNIKRSWSYINAVVLLVLRIVSYRIDTRQQISLSGVIGFKLYGFVRFDFTRNDQWLATYLSPRA